ncbi:MAG TPA: FtsQ-type POTRA domain-containing protein, partial [Bacillota bacterium]|nr:FtsQ-type POTRA domain-containing protein [Bacillota bacterium]
MPGVRFLIHETMNEFESAEVERLDARSRTNRQPNFSLFYGILFLLSVLLVFFNSELFSIKEVSVEGNQDLSQEDVLFLTKLNKGKMIFQVNTKKVSQNLLRNPQIASAKVMIHLPNRVFIEITERRASCLLLYQENLLVVGEDGIVIRVKDENEPIKLPVVTGIQLSRVQCGERITSPEFKTVMEIIMFAGDGLREFLSEIDLTNYRLLLDLPNWRRSLRVELGDGENIEEKIALNLRSILSNTSPDSLSQID